MRLGPISRSDLIKRLRALGWEGPITGRKHQHMVKGDHQLTIPNPHRGDIGVNLLKIVLKEAGISRDEWIRQW
jgi:predicted RNA binding protein YcfA (HicA-like mRNA interferase family)